MNCYNLHYNILSVPSAIKYSQAVGNMQYLVPRMKQCKFSAHAQKDLAILQQVPVKLSRIQSSRAMLHLQRLQALHSSRPTFPDLGSLEK